jgi:hypothetical protein
MTVSINDAERHLRTDATDWEEVSLLLTMSQAMIMAYIGTPPATATEAIQRRIDFAPALDAATLLVLGELWMNRESSTSTPLSDAVKNLLQMFREPTCA